MIPQACQWLDSELSRMKADLIELANLNSGSHNLEGLGRVAEWLESWMDLKAARFNRVELPDRVHISDAGQRLSVPSAPALRWDFRAEAKRRVLLMIHYDTVFGSSHVFQSCRELDENRLSGPGVADAKGGILVLRNALHALTSFELLSEVGWTILLNPDEELGSPSSAALIQTVAPEFEFGLLFEPALPDNSLVSQRKGSGNYDLVVHGKAAHAGRHFEDGRNAVAHLCEMLSNLHKLNGLKEGATINVGSIQGGTAVNIVPELAVGRFNVRVPDEASAQWFTENLESLVARANSVEGFRVELHGGITSPPKLVDARCRKLMTAVEAAVEATHVPPIRWRATGGVCDGNKLAAAGLPNIDTMGPIGDGLHSSQEWVQVDSLAQKSKVIVSLLHAWDARAYSV